MHDSDRERLTALMIAGVGFGSAFVTRKIGTAMPSPRGIELIKAWEGFRALPYKDIAGHWTIGYGTRITAGQASAMRNGITEERAEKLMLDHIRRDSEILNLAHHGFSQRIIDAVLSLAYNVGPYSVGSSRMFEQLRTDNIYGLDGALAEWDWYYYTDPTTGEKEISDGLRNRRLAEQGIITVGSYRGPDGELIS